MQFFFEITQVKIAMDTVDDQYLHHINISSIFFHILTETMLFFLNMSS